MEQRLINKSNNSLFLVKENSSNDENPEFKQIFESSSESNLSESSKNSLDLKDLKIFVHSEVLAKKIYHLGIPSDLRGLALWSAKNFADASHAIIDVGSHLGMYSMAFRDAGAGAIYSFECNPVVYNALVNNLYGTVGTCGLKDPLRPKEHLEPLEHVCSVKPFPFALGDRNEANVGFYNRTQDGNENGFHMYDHEKKYIMFHPDKPKDTKLKLDMVKFDSLFRAHAPPGGLRPQSGPTSTEVKTPFVLPYKVNFVKVNVNGFEKQVFQGMEAMLKHDSPTLMFCSMFIDPASLNSDTSASHTMRLFQEELKVLRKDLFTYLESLGYKIMKINSSKDLCSQNSVQNHFIAKKI
jgi:hypothetical protein